MASLIGYHLSSVQGGIRNPFLANGYYGYEGGHWFPPSAARTDTILTGMISRNNSSVLAPNQTINGYITSSYKDVFYNGVHVTPSKTDVGNVVTNQELDIYVWNAHFNSTHLNAITGIDEGIILEGQQAPYTFKPLEEQNYKARVTSQGSSIIDNALIWHFDNKEEPSSSVTGNRIVAFSFMPDWNEGIKERLEWSTDILQSESGVEQRSGLYAAPRRFLQGNFIFYERERQLFNNTSSWGAQTWAIPLWPNIQRLKQDTFIGSTLISCETKNREFIVGGLAFLWKDAFTYEITEILAVGSDYIETKRPLLSNWLRGSRLYPARSAQFNQIPDIVRKTDRLQTANIEFRILELNSSTALPPKASYLKYPVLELTPDESQDLTTQYQRILLTLDNGQALPRVVDGSGFSFMCQGYRWLGMGEEARADYRGLLYYLNGKQKALWIPSYADDLTVVEIVSATQAILTIANCGYTRYGKDDPDKQHIAIQLKNGTRFYRKITNSIIKNDDQEQLAIDTLLGRQISPEQITRVSFMRLCRSDNDTVDINHETDNEGVANSQLVFRRVRDNEL